MEASEDEIKMQAFFKNLENNIENHHIYSGFM